MFRTFLASPESPIFSSFCSCPRSNVESRRGEGRAPANWEDGAGMGRGGVQAATFGGEVRGDGGGGGGSNWFDSVGAGSSSVA